MSKGRKPRKAKDAQAPKRGRVGGKPTMYSEELVERICARLELGETLTSICGSPGMPERPVTVYEWMAQRPELSVRIARARQIGFDAIAEDCARIADEAPRMAIGANSVSVDSGDVAHKKLRIWTRLQLLAKWDPKRYGDKLEVKTKGKARVEVSFKQRGTPTDER